MSTGDGLTICIFCGQSYYVQYGHTCRVQAQITYPTTWTFYDAEKEQLRKDLADARKWARRMKAERDALREANHAQYLEATS